MQVDLGNFSSVSDERMVEAADRVLRLREQPGPKIKTAHYRNFRRRPGGNTAGPIVYNTLLWQRDNTETNGV